MTRPYTIGLICARGGSKGISRKNLRPLGGKPLLGWAIETARSCPSIDKVVLSTEDDEIATVPRGWRLAASRELFVPGLDAARCLLSFELSAVTGS